MTAWGEAALGAVLQLSAPAEGGGLAWAAAAGCPSETEVVTAVERYLGVPIAESSGAHKKIAASASKQRGGWVARVEVMDGDGERERTLPAAPTCGEAAEAAALVIAISIDPAAVERTEAARAEDAAIVPAPETAESESASASESEAASESEPEPEPPPVQPTAPTITPSPATPPRRTMTLRGAVGVHGGVEFGALPGATGIVGASVSLLGPNFRVFVDANVLPLDRDAVRGASVDYRLWAVGVGGCPVFAVATQWSLAPCVAVEVGQALGVPTGGFVGSPRTSRAWWAAARLLGRVQWSPHRLVGLYVAPELVVPFVRPEFFVDDPDDPVHQARAAGVRGTLGVEVQFP